MSMYGCYPNPDVCREKKHWVCEKSGCMHGCENTRPLINLMNCEIIEHACETVKNFLSLFPESRILSPIEEAFVSEAMMESVKKAML